MSQLFMRRPHLDHLPEMPALPTGYVLREYQEGDALPLVAVTQAAFPEMDWTVEKVMERLILPADVVKTYVATFEGVPVATASCRLLPDLHPGSGYVHWVATDPAHGGKRLGTALTLATLYEFKRLGCKDAVLETDDHRLPAIKTYQNLGFVPDHRDESHPERWVRVVADLLAAANM